MPEFQILDERRYALKVKGVVGVGFIKSQTNKVEGDKDMLPFWRWEHRVTIGYRARDFMVFVDQLKQAIHAEEIVGGHLEVVEDTQLFDSLLQFAGENGFCDILPPIMKPSEERFV
jgi:hypothetical protein